MSALEGAAQENSSLRHMNTLMEKVRKYDETMDLDLDLGIFHLLPRHPLSTYVGTGGERVTSVACLSRSCICRILDARLSPCLQLALTHTLPPALLPSCPCTPPLPLFDGRPHPVPALAFLLLLFHTVCGSGVGGCTHSHLASLPPALFSNIIPRCSSPWGARPSSVQHTLTQPASFPHPCTGSGVEG